MSATTTPVPADMSLALVAAIDALVDTVRKSERTPTEQARIMMQSIKVAAQASHDGFNVKAAYEYAASIDPELGFKGGRYGQFKSVGITMIDHYARPTEAPNVAAAALKAYSRKGVSASDVKSTLDTYKPTRRNNAAETDAAVVNALNALRGEAKEPKPKTLEDSIRIAVRSVKTVVDMASPLDRAAIEGMTADIARLIETHLAE